MRCQDLDLGSAFDWLCQIGLQPIRITTQIHLGSDASSVWNSVLDFQMSFCGKTSGFIEKCWQFSQAGQDYRSNNLIGQCYASLPIIIHHGAV